MSKLTVAQERAMKNYRKKNPEKTRYNSYKGTTKTFIKNYATLEDLELLQELMETRKGELKKTTN